MCVICGFASHLRGCPDAEPGWVAGTCSYCNEEIEDGETAYRLDNQMYHEDCFSDAATSILMKDYGAIRIVAEAEHGY